MKMELFASKLEKEEEWLDERMVAPSRDGQVLCRVVLEIDQSYFSSTSPIRALISACMCFASLSHRWHG